MPASAHKVAYPEECGTILAQLKKEVIAMDEINLMMPNAGIALDDLMKRNLVRRILVPINGDDYIYLEATPDVDATFRQGRRNFSRLKR